MLKTRSRLGLKDQSRVLTAGEFAGAEFEKPFRYERVEGRLVVLSPSGKAHNQLIWAILKRLSIYDDGHPGIVAMAVPEAWIRTRDSHDRLGDIGVYLTADEPQSDDQYQMIPGLVFEIVSEGREERDYVAKRREYSDLGIREYVLVDPFRKVVTVLTHGQQEYVAKEIKPGAVYTSRWLPGFELFLQDLPW